MSNKYLIILVTAFNPHSRHITSVGDLRLKQYVEGFGKIFELSQSFPQFDYVVVDNTIEPHWVMPENLKRVIDKIPHLKKIFFQDNFWGSQNKGCGVLVSLKKVFAETDIKQYEYCIYFEPRQLLTEFHFFEKFLHTPANYFKIEKYRVTALTKSKWIQLLLKILPIFRKQFNVGLFSLRTEVLRDYLAGIVFQKMADEQIGMEEDMYKKLKNKNIVNVKSLGILWHNAFEDIYISY